MEYVVIVCVFKLIVCFYFSSCRDMRINSGASDRVQLVWVRTRVALEVGYHRANPKTFGGKALEAGATAFAKKFYYWPIVGQVFHGSVMVAVSTIQWRNMNKFGPSNSSGRHKHNYPYFINSSVRRTYHLYFKTHHRFTQYNSEQIKRIYCLRGKSELCLRVRCWEMERYQRHTQKTQ